MRDRVAGKNYLNQVRKRMAEKDNVESFTDLYRHITSENRFISALLPGHLAIEFLLQKLVEQYDPKLSRLSNSLSHARLIELNLHLGNITADQRSVLVAINTLRNKLAHQLTFSPTVEELKPLWRSASKAFSDFTDGIDQGLGALEVASSVDDLDGWEISELFIQICYDLHHIYIDRGGDWDEF